MTDIRWESTYVLKKKYFLSQKTAKLIRNDGFLNVF